MSLSDRLRAKALEAAEKAKDVAAENATRAVTGAREALETRSGTAGPRLLALLRMDDDQPITIEVLVLVDAVHKDGDARELSDRDVLKAAKRRYRRLGAMDDTTAATAAIDGSVPSVLTTFALRTKDRVGLSASGPTTKRAVIATL